MTEIQVIDKNLTSAETLRYHNSPKGNIVYIKSSANSDYWDELWNDKKDCVEKNTKRTSRHNPLFRLFEKYLAKGSVILEGGCGRGELVYGLTKIGYRCVGVDFAKRTVDTLNKHVPELDIRLGNVANLEGIESSSFDAYYSGGVIEHFWDGMIRL